MTTVREAATILASMCDGAVKEDGVGYNKGDSYYAKRIIAMPKWSKYTQDALYDRLRKYQRQLMYYGIDYNNLLFEQVYSVEEEEEENDKIKEKEELDKKTITIGFFDENEFPRFGAFYMEVHYDHRDKPKEINYPKWNPSRKIWMYTYISKKMGEDIESFIDKYSEDFNVVVTEPARNKLESLKNMVPIVEENYIHYDKENKAFVFKIDYKHKDIAKEVYPRKWDANNKYWIYKDTGDIVKKIYDMYKEYAEECNIKCDKYTEEEFNRYKNEISELEESKNIISDIKHDVTELEKIDYPLKVGVALYDHQKKAVAIAMNSPSVGLLMEQGTGKTLASIAASGIRFENGDLKRRLIVAPKSVIDVWKNEYRTFADFPYNLMIAEGNKKKKEEIFDEKYINDNELNIRVISYDSISARTLKVKDESTDTIVKKQTGGLYETVEKWLSVDPDHTEIVLDESQRIKNKDSNRSKSLHKLGDVVKYTSILTGTPITKSPVDFFSQYLFLNKRIFGTNFYEFRNRYCEMGGYKDKQIVGYKNIPELVDKAHSISYRVTKDEALDLPEEVEQFLYCELDESKKTYKDIQDKFRAEILGKNGEHKSMRVKNNVVIAQLRRLSEVTGGFLPMEDDDSSKKIITQVGNEKLSVLEDFVENYPPYDKLVIFAIHLAEIDAIKALMTKLGRTVDVIKGSVENRGEIIRKFQEETDPNVLVIQTRTGGLGITLTRAHTVIFYSYDYNLEDYEQAKARVHRSGQRHMVSYVHIIAKNTIDESIMNVLKNKKAISDALVDLREDLIGEMNAYDD